MSKRTVNLTTLVFMAVLLACFQNCGRDRSSNVNSLNVQSLGIYKGACDYSARAKFCVERWQYPNESIDYPGGCSADGGSWVEHCPVNSDTLGACFALGDGDYASVQAYHYFGFYGGISAADEQNEAQGDCERNGHQWIEIHFTN